MKPRLNSAPLTIEDALIWEHWVPREPWTDFNDYKLTDASMESDRRDAYLMFWLAKLVPKGYEALLRLGKENCAVPAVHILVRSNPEWPQGYDIGISGRSDWP